MIIEAGHAACEIHSLTGKSCLPAQLGVVEEDTGGMVPCMTCFIMRRRGENAIRASRSPIGLPFEIGPMTSRTIIFVQPFPLGEIEGLLRRGRLSLPRRNSPNTGGATQSEDHQPTEDHSFLHHVTFSQVIITDAAWLSIWHSNR